MSTTKAGGRSNPGMPAGYESRTIEMQSREIDRLRAILSAAVVWLDGDDSEPWMGDARRTVR